MNKKLKNKVTLGIVVGALTITGIYNAFAGVSEANTKSINNRGVLSDSTTEKVFGSRNNGRMFKSVELNDENAPQKVLEFKGLRGDGCIFDFTALVEDGIIDQSTADEIEKYLEQKAEDKKAEFEKLQNMTEDERKAYLESNNLENNKAALKVDLFAELVEKEIITQEQAEALKENSKMKMGGFRFNGPDITMLTEELGLDQTTVDAINKYLEKNAEERKAEFEKLKDMTEDERKAYMDSIKNTEKTNIVDELVNEGLITKEQAAALEEKFKAKMENLGNGFMIRFDFSKLIDDGIISQETADKITAFLTDNKEEIKANIENNTNIFDMLVTEGIITQEEATAIGENFKRPLNIKRDFNFKDKDAAI